VRDHVREVVDGDGVERVGVDVPVVQIICGDVDDPFRLIQDVRQVEIGWLRACPTIRPARLRFEAAASAKPVSR
jgi:hypothetical protein